MLSSGPRTAGMTSRFTEGRVQRRGNCPVVGGSVSPGLHGSPRLGSDTSLVASEAKRQGGRVPPDMTYSTIEALRGRKEDVEAEIVALDVASAGKKFSETQRETFASLHDELKELKETIEERTARERLLRRLAGTDAATPAWEAPHGDLADEAGPGAPHVRAARSAALRVIERNQDVLSPEAGDRLERHVRSKDPQGLDARYLSAVASEHYRSAFGKMVMDPTTGHLRFTPEEVEAVRRVSAVEAERALSVGVGSGGQFAIPFTLDPSVLLSSAGVISPIRRLARQETIGTDVWKGVSSAGITAAFAAEAIEASDNAPVLAQPTVDTAKAFAFCPFSIEIGQDWASLESELARLFADAKDILEATAFLTGSGTDAPKGVLTGLSVSQRVQTATTNVYALADVYALKAALPARFVGAASWTQHPTNLDRAFRFVGGNSTEPIFYPTRDGNILGIPTFEWSTMISTMATTQKIALYGDFSQFLIADRLGGTIELIPHLFGATNRFPTGQRGLYYYWRTGSDVLVQNAFRYLEVL
jgi:HK97 family phage major capsid protein